MEDQWPSEAEWRRLQVQPASPFLSKALSIQKNLIRQVVTEREVCSTLYVMYFDPSDINGD